MKIMEENYMPVKANNKDSFISWLSSRKVSSKDIEIHSLNIEMIGRFYADQFQSDFDIWEIDDPNLLSSIMNKVLNSKTAKDDKSYALAKDSLMLLKKYHTDRINSMDDSHPEWRTLSSADNEIDFKERLESATVYLEHKYRVKPALTLRQLQDENKNINFGYFAIWTKSIYGISASQYLISKGLITPKQVDERPVSVKLSEVVDLLEKKYSVTPARSMKQMQDENKDIDFSRLNTWTKELFGQTAKEFLASRKLIQQHSRFGMNLKQHY